MDWSREPIRDFFKYHFLRSTAGFIWLIGSALCLLGSAGWWWFGSELPGRPVWYLLWPVLSLLFVLLLDASSFQARWLRIGHASIVVLVSTYPIWSDIWDIAVK